MLRAFVVQIGQMHVAAAVWTRRVGQEPRKQASRVELSFAVVTSAACGVIAHTAHADRADMFVWRATTDRLLVVRMTRCCLEQMGTVMLKARHQTFVQSGEPLPALNHVRRDDP